MFIFATYTRFLSFSIFADVVSCQLVLIVSWGSCDFCGVMKLGELLLQEVERKR